MTYEIVKAEIPKIKRDKRLKPYSPQKLAAQQGLVHFQGAVCAKGHSGLRYTKGAQCVECVGIARGNPINPRGRSNVNHDASLKAAKEGSTTYVPSTPCKHGHSLRYVNSNNCVECDKLALEKHKLSAKYARIKKIYGLSKDAYLSMVHLQNSRCSLCMRHEPDHFKLHVDHCHNTNKVRGLLCGKCNQGIGLLNHDPELIAKAAIYCK